MRAQWCSGDSGTHLYLVNEEWRQLNARHPVRPAHCSSGPDIRKMNKCELALSQEQRGGQKKVCRVGMRSEKSDSPHGSEKPGERNSYKRKGVSLQ